MICVTHSISCGYDLTKAKEYFSSHYENSFLFNDVVFGYKESKYLYIFSFGAVVAWGFSAEEAEALIQNFESFADDSITSKTQEIFEYKLGKKTMINELTDTITLEDDHDSFYKLSLSYALAQSVKLLSHETELKATMARMESIPKSLAKTGQTSLKSKEIAMKMGELYIQKASINGNLNFMHTPKTIWDHPEVERHYHMAADFLDLHDRVESLNMGLSMIQDLLEILQDHLNHKHNSMLEWIIILLIFVEVLLVVKDHLF
jgi:uncharacterized Rmd1/YagE family protein